MKKYYWLKIGEHFFEDDRIIYLESLENGEKYVLVWIKLLLKCLKDKDNGEYGLLRFSDKIPYDDTLLSKVLKCDIDTLRVAMKIFAELDMITILEDKTIYIECVQKLIGKESDSAERVRIHRERKKLIENRNKVTKCNVTCNANKEEEIEVEEEIEKELRKDASVNELVNHFYDLIKEKVQPPTFKNKKPNLNSWYDDIEKLHRIDGATIEDIRCVMEYVVTDEFWKNNILSGDKLRKHYDRLFLQYKKNKPEPEETMEERLARIDRMKADGTWL